MFLFWWLVLVIVFRPLIVISPCISFKLFKIFNFATFIFVTFFKYSNFATYFAIYFFSIFQFCHIFSIKFFNFSNYFSIKFLRLIFQFCCLFNFSSFQFSKTCHEYKEIDLEVCYQHTWF